MFLRLAVETGKKARRRGLLLIFGGLLLALGGPVVFALLLFIVGVSDIELVDSLAALVGLVGLAIYVTGNFAYASAKGYVGWMWALLSFFIIGPIVLMLLPDKAAK